ncbi:hypothetical protein CTM85_20300 [Photobacterium phosphoreum]|nr:hypothetical protein CTM85_20300 [Photobacterium phosphoreum]
MNNNMVFFSTFLLLIILSLIHRGTAFSQPIINQNSILLGTVNGDVINNCLLYTSDAADDKARVDFGGLGSGILKSNISI